jgi:general secretion pathway protein D
MNQQKATTMKTINKFGSLQLLALCALWLAGTVNVHAQGRGGGGGGFGGGGGGFGGGFGAGGGNRGGTTSSSTSSATASRDYPNSTLPGEATFSYDPETKSIIVMTDDKTLESVHDVIANLDRPKPEVLIKVVFLEVQHDDDLDLGVEGSFTKNTNPSFFGPGQPGVLTSNVFGLAGLGSTGQTIGQSTMPTGAGLYSMVGNDFTATVRAIASKEKVEVLSRPSIMVRNNQPATITVGQSVPLITGVTQATANSAAVNNITYQNVGIILQVTPFISTDGLVEMIVAPQISSLSSQTVSIATNENAPVIDLRSASTVVVTPDGQTVVIGGLMENDKTVIDSKIPLLGDIPLLGNLFKHKQNAVTKKELLIFLTPYVVDMPTQMASLTSKEKANAALSQKAFGPTELDKAFDKLPTKPHSIWDQQPSPPPVK